MKNRPSGDFTSSPADSAKHFLPNEPSLMHRPTIGILALVLLGIAAGLYFWQADAERNQMMFMSACMRVGLVLGALWLAHPQLTRIPGWVFRLGIVIAILAAMWPKRLLIFVPLIIVIWLIKPRSRAPEVREHSSSKR